MDHHSYRQHISEEPDMFEAGLHYEGKVENSLHYRQIRVLNHIALLFGDSYNDNNDDNLGNSDDRSTPPWQQGDDYDTFSNGYISTRHLPRSSSFSADRYHQHCDTTNSNSISGNKDESDLYVDSQVRGPFVTTLPPSLLSPTAATLPSPPPDVAAVKRGPGRPRGSSKKQPPSPHPPDTDAVTMKQGAGRPKSSLSFKNRSTSISSIITPTVTTRARASAQSVYRVRLQVTEPSLASASSSSNANATTTKAVNAASILALCPVPLVMVMPKKRGPGRPKGSKNRRRAHY